METRPERVRGAVRPAFGVLVALVALVSWMHLGGLALFTSGFLLQRNELRTQSVCRSEGTPAWSVPVPPSGAAEGDAVALAAWDALLAQGECTLPPRFHKAVVWIIDALRYDFVAPKQAQHDPSMHGHLTAASEAVAHTPGHAFLAQFIADAPTTTLQRLKGLTTGSLPTFVEAGANFGGAGRVAEDTWLAQFRARRLAERKLAPNATQGAGMAFVGDDTWDTVFSALFDADRQWPFSSFNVEDLDTVDAGVEEHMLEAMARPDASLTVAHSLGVDHVGHRFGPSHSRMALKLAQMDALVRKVMHTLDDDTLFVLMGDHGMDATGDHGGDSELEVGAALFLYAKKALHGHSEADVADIASVLAADAFVPFTPLGNRTHRSVAQIDWVPTIALLLGTPIPFNNLGTIIPEVFASQTRPLGHPDSPLLRALRMNARQVHTYIQAYAQQASDLATFEKELATLWATALQADARYVALEKAATAWRPLRAERQAAARVAAHAYAEYTRRTVFYARSVWAQFSLVKIVLGLALLAGGVLSTAWLWHRAAYDPALRMDTLARELAPSVYGAAAGVGVAIVALALSTVHPVLLSRGEWLVFAPALGAELGVLVAAFRHSHARGAMRAPLATYTGAGLLLFHAMLFASNSFVMWEDRITLTLLALVLFARGVRGYGAPLVRLQKQMPLLAVSALVLVRMAAMSRVCREEQAPYCTPSFYARTHAVGDAENPAYAYARPATNSPWTIGVAYVVAYLLPDLLRRALQMGQAYHATAERMLTYVVRPSLLIGAAYWLVDWAHGLDTLDAPTQSLLLALKRWAGLGALVLTAVAGLGYWIVAPLSLSVRREGDRVAVLGFANTFGSKMLLLTSLVFALLFLVAQPMGQLALALCYLSLLLLVELGDNERDVDVVAAALLRDAAKDEGAQVPPILPPMPTLLESVTLSLLGVVAFFATGHQATLASIQWRTAFVGFTTVTYPWSPVLVTLNAFGPLCILPAFGAILLPLWNVAPHRAPTSQAPMVAPMTLLRSAMGFLLCQSVLALSAAIFATHFRRHLMLFKIWVPRFMTGGVALLLADLAVLLAIGAVWRVASQVHSAFGTRFT